MSSSLMKWLGMLLIWFVFALITFKTCVHECCTGCTVEDETKEEIIPAAVEEVQRYPVDFQWNNAQAYANEGFDAIRERLVREMSDDNKLVVTGRYYESEQAPEGFKTMGIARATALRDLLAPDIPIDRITLIDRRIGDLDDTPKGYFESLNYEWEAADAEEEVEIIATENEATIHFPFSSSVKDRDPAIDDYLTKVADRLSQSTERVSITGYTDNIGNDDMNLKLSERRAKYIRDILKEKGVSTDRIDVAWKGEADPVSSNDTEAGRHNNRRVELRILN